MCRCVCALRPRCRPESGQLVAFVGVGVGVGVAGKARQKELVCVAGAGAPVQAGATISRTAVVSSLARPQRHKLPGNHREWQVIASPVPTAGES